MAERAVCNLSIEVPSLMASESEILLALLRQHLNAPAYLVGFEALGYAHCHIGGDDDVPVLVVTIFDEEDTYDFLAYEAVDDEVPAVVLGHLLGFRALIARNHLIHILMESTHVVFLVIHLAHTEEMHAAVAYGTYGMDEFLAGEPTVTKGISSTKSSLPGTLHHGYCAIGLLHVQFLIPCVVGVLLISFLGELALTFLVAQTVVLLLALLAVK